MELIHRLWAVDWRPANKGERAVCVCLAATTTVFTLAVPPVSAGISRLTGHPNLPHLLIANIALVGAWAHYPFVEYYWTGPRAQPGISDSPWLVGAAIVAVTTLEGRSARAGVSQRHGLVPLAFEAQSVFTGYMGLTAFRMGQIALRCWRLIDTPAERRQMRAYIIGWGLAVATNLHAALHLATRRFGLPFYNVPHPSRVTATLLVGCIAFLSSGALLEVRDRHSRARAYRRLEPLWQLVHQATPRVALFPPPPTPAAGETIGDLDLALYSRVFEIRDGLRELRCYADPAVEARAEALCRRAGLRGLEARATVEAALLADALRARAQGRRAMRAVTTRIGDTASTLPDAVTYLLQVDRAYRRSPLVAAALQPQSSTAPPGQGAA